MKAVITGGTKGIGKAIAYAFASAGADVAVCARGREELKELGDVLKGIRPGIRYIGHSADCTVKSELLEFCHVVRDGFSRVDVLVNNVGIYEPGGLLEEPEGLLERTLAANLYPAYRLARFFAPAMKERGEGHIFNICSVAALRAAPGAGAYTISKHALLGLSRSLREELGPSGIRVTSVLPGATLTASWEGEPVPDRFFIRPEDVAAAVLTSFHMSKHSTVEELLITPTFLKR